MADVYSLSIRTDTTEVTRAKQALAGLSSGAMKAESTTKNLARSASRTSGAFRLQRGAAQQLGFQLQDIAVQAQGGVSAFQILGQQGSQLAGVFGPGGALFGAVIAIGAAIGGTLFRSTETASDGVETLTERIGGLRESIEDLTQAQIDGLKVEFFAENRARQAAIVAERENIRDLTRELTNLKEAERAAEEQALLSGGQSAQLTELREEVRNTSEELTIAKGALQTYFSEADASAKGLQKLIDGNDDAATAIEDANKSVMDLTDSLRFQIETYGESARVIELAKLDQLEKNGADATAISQARELTNALYDRIEAERQEQQLQAAIMQSTKIGLGDDPILQRIEAQRRGQELLAEESAMWAQKIANNQQTIQQQSIATVGASIGAMQNFFEQGSAEFIAFGLLQKGLMAGQAVMAANLAATLALTAQVPGDPTGPARAIAQAETIRTLGYINAGLILATGIGEAVSGARQMGGSVTGGRSYLVGESGPEVVTMGGSGVVTPSSVMDASKNQGGDWVVNINNAPPGTRTESRTDDSGNRYTEVFIADMANGGPMSRTMQSTFGLRRQGR